MNDPNIHLVTAFAVLAAIAIASAAFLRAWRGWLDVKRLEIAGSRKDLSVPSSAARIELADLKERVRRLEAIANGIET